MDAQPSNHPVIQPSKIFLPENGWHSIVTDPTESNMNVDSETDEIYCTGYKKEHTHLHEFYTVLEVIAGVMCPVGLFAAIMCVLVDVAYRGSVFLSGVCLFFLGLLFYALAAKGIILLETSNDTLRMTREVIEIRKLLADQSKHGN